VCARPQDASSSDAEGETLTQAAQHADALFARLCELEKEKEELERALREAQDRGFVLPTSLEQAGQEAAGQGSTK
jgi:hypothetical protein